MTMCHLDVTTFVVCGLSLFPRSLGCSVAAVLQLKCTTSVFYMVCVCIVFALPSLHFHKSLCSHNFIDGVELVSTCPSGIEFLADDTIGPGGVGLFKCTVTNGIDLRWTVNDIRYVFQGDLTIGHIEENENGLAVLLVKDVGNLTGNRTSMLYYEPDPGFIGVVTIICGGDRVGDCPVNFSVTGELVAKTMKWNH